MSDRLDLSISAATKRDCRTIAPILLKRRAEEPSLQKVAGRSIQRLLYERWVVPRFLSRSADTFRADIGDEMVGYLVLLYEHPAVAILDAVALEGFKGRSIEESLLAHAEDVAGHKQYPYLRAGLAPGDPAVARTFSNAGFQPLEFRRWEFVGQVAARPAPEDTTMRALIGRLVAERRAHYLQAQLDAVQPAARALIEALYVPKRPSAAQAFEIVHEGKPIGYLSVRRERTTYVLSLSTLPEWWGKELEASLVASFPAAAARASKVDVRLRLDSTSHADAAGRIMAELGLDRTLASPDIWYKAIQNST